MADDGAMPAHLRRAATGLADARRVAASLSADLRAARLAAGISQSTAARAAGISRSQWGRLERNEETRPDLVELCCAGRALGLQLASRYYVVESPVRDKAQLALLRRFEAQLRAPLRLHREVALPIRGDLRAWDGMVDGEDRPFFIEGESHVSDAQALERRLRLKQRDDPRAGTIVLVLTRSDHHRELLHAEREVFRDLLPLDGPAILRSVRAGRRPPASGIVLV
jgi:transcriptional regulator with XRE-family HTH domain